MKGMNVKKMKELIPARGTNQNNFKNFKKWKRFGEVGRNGFKKENSKANGGHSEKVLNE